MTEHFDITALNIGVQVFIPLNRLKKSPKNARKTPHSAATLESYAASIAAKGILQNLVVEPELDDAGAATGFFLVTIGEGRRLAQMLRVKRKEIKKSEPMPCVINTIADPHEISLDENITREAMHPADQFEAFQRLVEERGMGVEDIAARFGVSAHTVRQRLRLAAVSPRLIHAYRNEELALDQLMAFGIVEDHERQEAVYERLPSWNREAHYIRRMLTETHVPARDRRAVFVGTEAYIAAGGHIVRDLFTEDSGGYFEDAALLDRLATDKLSALVQEVRDAEGWKWSEAHIEFPHGHGTRRVFPRVAALSPEDEERRASVQAQYDALYDSCESTDEVPEDIEQQLGDLENDLERFDSLTRAYDPDDKARAGVVASLSHDGSVRLERGFVRPEDESSQAEDAEAAAAGGGEEAISHENDAEPQPEPEGDRALSDALTRDLTTHRTLALRQALDEQSDVALRALTHALALQAFYRSSAFSCLELRATSTALTADGLDDTPMADALHARHDAWGTHLPQSADDLWGHILGMDVGAITSLLAYCVSLTVNAVDQPFGRYEGRLTHADQLASAVALDMAEHWRPTARSYFSRVPKPRILSAVREAVGDEAADRLIGLKKQPMAEAAEALIAQSRWLPPILRTTKLADLSTAKV